MMGIADMEMKTSVKPTPTGADSGINRIALALLVAAGAVSAMGVGKLRCRRCKRVAAGLCVF